MWVSFLNIILCYEIYIENEPHSVFAMHINKKGADQCIYSYNLISTIFACRLDSISTFSLHPKHTGAEKADLCPGRKHRRHYFLM